MTEINNTLPIYHEIVNVAEIFAKEKTLANNSDETSEEATGDGLAEKLKNELEKIEEENKAVKGNYKQVAHELINDTQLKADLFDMMTNMRHRPSFYWAKFKIWKGYFKEINPQISELSSKERKKVYDIMFRDFNKGV